MSSLSSLSRRVYRMTAPATPTSTLPLQLTTDTIPLPPPPTAVILKVHAISLNRRDAAILHNANPWHVAPNLIPCSDAAGAVIAIGSHVSSFQIGDRVAPILDRGNISGREQGRIWPAADVDGVLAEYVLLEEEVCVKLPEHLSWEEAACLPCAGLTAWSALGGSAMMVGSSVLIQGTGGVSMMALKFARAAGCRVILSSGSDAKLHKIGEQFSQPPLLTVNYATNQHWHEEVLRLNGGVGVDVVIENGGTSSLVQSIKCTKRGGTVSQVGYLGKQDPRDLEGLLSVLIDRRVNLRGINVGSKHDFEDMNAFVAATGMRFKDTIDKVFPFETAEEAIDYVWHGRQVGKVVVQIDHDT